MNSGDDKLIDDVIRFLKFQASLSGGNLYLHSALRRDAGESPPSTVKENNIVPRRNSDNEKSSSDPVENRKESVFKSGINAPVASTSLFDVQEEWTSADSLESLNNQICTCLKCPLGKTRTNFVFGVGNPDADIMLIGEAPGAEEDRLGEPFVGRAGQLLNKILEAVGFKREEVYICNILKCRPPNNRDPLPTEVEQCEPYLHKQIELIKPKVLLSLGRIAAQTLLKTTEPIGSMRGRMHSYLGIPMMVVYHPAALLRNPNFKRTMWEDMKQFRAFYDQQKTDNC